MTRPKLRRSLRLLDLVAIGINGIIGTGIFFLPGSVAASMGPAAVVTFAISAVLCALLVLCFAEVSSRFTGTGGAMLYSDAAFGPLVGFGVGWLTWGLPSLAASRRLSMRPQWCRAALLPQQLVPHRLEVPIDAGCTALTFPDDGMCASGEPILGLGEIRSCLLSPSTMKPSMT